ncbi:MAG: His/Gly/Thr/Pro-type tRNA ligase C-terminal domain-containing protein, partial [Candidatus Woesearchaeota archaeon]
MLKGIAKNDIGKEGIAELEEVLSYLSEDEKKNINFVPSLARGLGYYTGTVFEGFLKNSEITSSILGGGRYNEMVKGLVGKDVPAVGFAFGLEPITEYIKLSNKEKIQKTLAKVLVVPIGVEKEAMKIANELRRQGINTDFAIGKKGISKSLDYANYLGIQYAIIVGEDEIKQDKVKLKDMTSGKEEMIAVKDVVKKLKS